MRKIIDTHLHTWDLDQFDYYWLKNDSSILKKNYGLDQIEPQLNNAGVTAAILVQATNQMEESNWLLQLASCYQWVLGAVVWLPLTQPQQVAKLLEGYQKDPFFVGVRHQIHDEPDHEWLLQPPVLDSLRMLAQHQIPFDLVGVKHYHIETALKVAKKIPGLTMVFDHLNQLPVTVDLPPEKWTDLLTEASRHPGFYAKISGLGTAIKRGMIWTSEDIKPYLEFIFNSFGTDRVFCGGDWPVSLLAGSYDYTWLQYQHVIDTVLDETQREKIYHKNAERFYQVKHS